MCFGHLQAAKSSGERRENGIPEILTFLNIELTIKDPLPGTHIIIYLKMVHFATSECTYEQNISFLKQFLIKELLIIRLKYKLYAKLSGNYPSFLLEIITSTIYQNVQFYFSSIMTNFDASAFQTILKILKIFIVNYFAHICKYSQGGPGNFTRKF